jgi:hypothetical protein
LEFIVEALLGLTGVIHRGLIGAIIAIQGKVAHPISSDTLTISTLEVVGATDKFICEAAAATIIIESLRTLWAVNIHSDTFLGVKALVGNPRVIIVLAIDVAVTIRSLASDGQNGCFF